LTVLARSVEHLKAFERSNLEFIDGYLPRKNLKRIQNESEVHLCLSEAEGFGHYICEALACGAIVMSVNGSPMNELVQPERGILLKVDRTDKMSKARKFFFDTVDLEKKIAELLAMKEDEKRKIKLNARIWFEENELFFEDSFAKAIEHCFND
jgi:glycosyltransferase involved in cell wall biosynthesis